MTRVELKQLSKSQLKGNWKTPVLVMLVYTIATMALSFMSEFSSSMGIYLISTIFLIGLAIWFSVGFANFFLRFSETDGKAKFDDLLVSKKSILKSLGLFALMFVIGIVLGIIIVFATSSMIVFSESVSTGMIVGVLIFAIVLSIPIVILELALAMTPYIFVDKEELGLIDSIKLSIKMMKGNKWSLFVINLSFIGWALLCILTLGIGYLWLGPYIQLTITNFYIDLDNNFKEISI
ncbi:DUF975 family protein [Romboutsia sp. 1001216sp1]|uniref:DUF975 family protein n=1 Tax=Romboutsia sp. 1001216sp1 TaxID=2986997 RepID=UPI002330B3F1|nr:DUF975 family protein [Romboutsia sp. 1001216sp1]MDB8804380.1 DUF975 family protein [Romboutsia sp. 1001216sp1]MDB8807662.1 DUF975 family protein [Romboutsia sp. 1001216sp1]MDB8810026.1 DUF975 family protein [Romboutsia sp. 1001216sp1]MDB8815776.1 DUF975 family protein [Romboutsia sp. 1001216sp1]MDB8819376.1 DUF975 family protein [Romboutsia sp. 1001216sp1]